MHPTGLELALHILNLLQQLRLPVQQSAPPVRPSARPPARPLAFGDKGQEGVGWAGRVAISDIEAPESGDGRDNDER